MCLGMYGDIRACFRVGNDSVLNTHFLASESEQEHSSSISHMTFYWQNHHMGDTVGTERRMGQHMRRQVIETDGIKVPDSKGRCTGYENREEMESIQLVLK